MLDKLLKFAGFFKDMGSWGVLLGYIIVIGLTISLVGFTSLIFQRFLDVILKWLFPNPLDYYKTKYPKITSFIETLLLVIIVLIVLWFLFFDNYQGYSPPPIYRFID
jgi:hypothetical protein